MGHARTIKRNRMKKDYKRFSEAWRRERAYQRMMLSEGTGLPKGTPVLGKRPTFTQWSEMVKTAQARATATPQEVQSFKDENIDLSWDDDQEERQVARQTEAGGSQVQVQAGNVAPETGGAREDAR